MCDLKLDLANNREIFEVEVDGETFTVEVKIPYGLNYCQERCPRLNHCPKSVPSTVKRPITEPTFPKGEHGILAPMPGNIIGYEKKVGDSVKTGETIVVLEAMKMYNNLAAPCDGVIKSLPFPKGENVKKYDVLCVMDC